MRTSTRDWKSPRTLVAFALVGLLLPAVVFAEGSGASPEVAAVQTSPVAEAWLVSTRCVPLTCSEGVGPERFSFQVVRGECGQWQSSDSETFFAGVDASCPVVVFIHGNRTDSCGAIQDGWPVYRRLLADAGGRPFRFVIWSWPAERIRGGPRNDALVKARRSDTQSFYLASWLERLPEDASVGLIGYSFGARVVGGALHLSEGGSLLGRVSGGAKAEEDRRPFRVMLVAGALDCEWLLPGNRNGLAGQAVERMFMTRNCCDPVLRLYPRMRRWDSSSALGFAGPASPGRLRESGLDFEVVPVECQVGRDHSWHTYLRSSAVRSRLAWYAFLDDAT